MSTSTSVFLEGRSGVTVRIGFWNNASRATLRITADSTDITLFVSMEQLETLLGELPLAVARLAIDRCETEDNECVHGVDNDGTDRFKSVRLS